MRLYYHFHHKVGGGGGGEGGREGGYIQDCTVCYIRDWQCLFEDFHRFQHLFLFISQWSVYLTGFPG